MILSRASGVPVVANALRLLSLPESVLAEVRSGAIPQSHARALLALDNPALIEETAQKVVQGRLLVRDIENMAKARKTSQGREPVQPANPNRASFESGGNFYREMELALEAELGRKVRISVSGEHHTISLDFYSREELADIAARLTKSSW